MFDLAQFFDMKRSETELLQTGAVVGGWRIFVSFGPFVLSRQTSWLPGALRHPASRILHPASRTCLLIKHIWQVKKDRTRMNTNGHIHPATNRTHPSPQIGTQPSGCRNALTSIS